MVILIVQIHLIRSFFISDKNIINPLSYLENGSHLWHTYFWCLNVKVWYRFISFDVILLVTSLRFGAYEII